MIGFLFELSNSLLDGIMVLVSYITNNNVFPHPLDPEDESECLERLSKGEDEAKRTLIEHNLRLVAHIVKKFDNTNEDIDDLISIGSIGLIKAINTYDPSKNVKLATYASRCIENEILMHFRQNKKTRREVLLHEPIGADKEGNEIALIDILGTDFDAVPSEVEFTLDRERLYKKLNELTEREKKVVKMRYGLNNAKKFTQREIASRLGISRSYVSRIEKKALEKLYKIFYQEG
ncbi:RNA polymerase sporulation sigma factor SigK [Selenihalanaerobacter shriftii]|uniref:RNA polymerase sporulation sigma factor SigK n=1 Tax=Selenihalanaerobacter shriftii TaxID=142842 RepID=UPI00389A72CA